VATATTRASDSDRNDTCQVLDSALSDGQLSMEEHRQRVIAATKATTLGELDSLVSDLQMHNAPAQVPAVTSQRGTIRLRIAVAVVVVLVGVGIAWALFGTNASSSKSSGSSTGPNPAAAAAPSTTPQAPPNLLTLGGLTGLLGQLQTKFGDTMGYQLLVYPDNAMLFRPDSANAHKTVGWSYSSNGWINTGPVPMPLHTVVGDLSKFDVQEVLGVMPAAPQTLNIKNPTQSYLSIESAKDGSLALMIYLSDGISSGSMQIAPDGTVKQMRPAGS
jgi:Domain of unknown function (DUF1707)